MNSHVSKYLLRYNDIEGSISNQYHDIAAWMGLSDSAFNILYALFQEGDGCPQNILYKNSGMSRKTAGSSLRKLQEEGIIRIEKASSRGNAVSLTEKGKQLVAARIAPVIAIENEIFASWTPEEREQFLSLGNRYLNTITKKFEELKETLKIRNCP